MGLLTGRGMLDPRYFRHSTPVIEGAMTALIAVIRPSPEDAQPEWIDGDWVYPTPTDLWRGMASVTPNKDWRARNREWAMEQTAEHAVRVQMNLAKNMLVHKSQWPASLVDIRHGDVVKVVDNPNDPILERYSLTVRNPIGASDNWHRTLLCDANLGSHYGEN